VYSSRFVLGRFGRDPSFFQYVEGSVGNRIRERAEYALTEINPSENPYLQWILSGKHLTALPFWLREENFEPIRNNLDRLEWQMCSLEDYLASAGEPSFDACNLSDIFEYMSEENYHNILRSLARAGRPGARLAYWNLLVPRSRPPSMADQWESLDFFSEELFRQDKAFFYTKFVVEELRS